MKKTPKQVNLPAVFTQRLLKNFPSAAIQARGDGTFVAQAPLTLPASWSVDTALVSFVVPIGFPSAAPAYFYTDMSVRLASGNSPFGTGQQTGPFGALMRWWLWKPQHWNPNRDDLLTFVRQIEQRFIDLRSD